MPGASMLACFDLDGTLVDSRGPFAASLRGALADLGLPDRRPEDLHHFLGPPFEETASAILLDAGRSADTASVEAMVSLYRGHYARDGVPATRLVPGIAQALDDLRGAGWVPVVVTSKNRPLAVTVLDHVGLLDSFAEVHGPGAADRGVAKATTLAAVLANLPHSGAVMIGDRRHDIEAATACEIPGIGVTWAGDHAHELRAAGAFAVLQNPAELRAAMAAALSN